MGIPYSSFFSNFLPSIAALILAKLYTVVWLSSLPETTINLPSGDTSTPCGLLGSGIKNKALLSTMVFMPNTSWPLILVALPALTNSAAFFQLTTCIKSVSFCEQPASYGGRPFSIPPT